MCQEPSVDVETGMSKLLILVSLPRFSVSLFDSFGISSFDVSVLSEKLSF